MKIYFSLLIASFMLFGATAYAGDEVPEGFYDKRDIKPFFSLKADYRLFNEDFIGDLNSMLFERNWRYYIKDSTGQVTNVDDYVSDNTALGYGQFTTSTFGFHFEVGVQYHQLLTAVDVNYTLTQVSEKPSDFNAVGFEMWDVKYNTYGADFKMGYMILPPDARINLIPWAGGGFSLLNVHFPSNYELLYIDAADEDMEPYSLQNKYYSTLAATMVAELELRLNLAGGVSVSGYGGGRYAAYDELEMEEGTTSYTLGQPSVPGHSYYGGGRITVTLKSAREKAIANREEELKRK